MIIRTIIDIDTEKNDMLRGKPFEDCKKIMEDIKDDGEMPEEVTFLSIERGGDSKSDAKKALELIERWERSKPRIYGVNPLKAALRAMQ